VTGEVWIPGVYKAPQIAEPVFLIEPHNAIIRSGFVREFFFEHGSLPIDERIAYGVSSERPSSSHWHSAFRIVEMFPFNKKLLQRKIYEYELSHLTEIKKRGFPLLPEQIRSQLKFTGSDPGVIFLTRRQDLHLAIIAERLER
jgi:hypothetical protein